MVEYKKGKQEEWSRKNVVIVSVSRRTDVPIFYAN